MQCIPVPQFLPMQAGHSLSEFFLSTPLMYKQCQNIAGNGFNLVAYGSVLLFKLMTIQPRSRVCSVAVVPADVGPADASAGPAVGPYGESTPNASVGPADLDRQESEDLNVSEAEGRPLMLLDSDTSSGPWAESPRS